MIYAIGEGEKNCLLASRIYAQRYPDSRKPRPPAFEKLKERFERTGKIGYDKEVRTKTVTNEENEFVVVATVVDRPHISQREISRELNISQASVGRILRKHKFHPYHVQLLQELDERDYQRRHDFCQWALAKRREQFDFFDFVLFSDEATFHKNGSVNRHNFHYYDTANPLFVRPIDHQRRWSLNVWAGIVGDHLIGPFFFNGNLNGIMYLQFLQHELQNMFDDLPLHIIQRLWFQQDGAPAHFTRGVRNYLNEVFGANWIGRGGPIQWPARSPDLTKLDFFLWGYVKEVVYQTEPTTREDMMLRISNAFHSIDRNMLRDVNNSFLHRIEICSQENGGHIEHIL